MGDSKFHDYNPIPVDPNKQQFEPTDAQPGRQHARMAGYPVSNSRMTPLRRPEQKQPFSTPVKKRAPYRSKPGE